MKFRRILEVLCLQVLQKRFWASIHDLCVQKRSCLPWSSDAFRKFSIFKVYKKISGRIFSIFASKNEAVCREIQTDYGGFPRASFIKRIWAHFLDFCVQKRSCLLLSRDAFWKFSLCEVYEERSGRIFTICVQKWSCFLQSSDAFWKFSPCEVYKKGFGRIITIYVSKNGAVCRKVKTHFGSFLHASFMKKFTGKFSRFLRPIMKLFVVEFRRILEVLRVQGLHKKISGRIFTIFVSKNEAVCCWVQVHFRSSLPARFTQKDFWAHFHDLCVQKWSCFLRSSDTFRTFSPYEVYKKVLGTLSRRLRPKTKLFALELRRILGVHCLQVLQIRLWAHIHSFWVHKWSSFSWSSDAFWKFSLCEVYKKFWAHFHDLCVQKRSCLPWSSDAFLKFFACKFCRKGSGRIIAIFASKNEAVCCEVQTDFGSFLNANFMKKFWAQFHD